MEVSYFVRISIEWTGNSMAAASSRSAGIYVSYIDSICLGDE